MLREGVTSVLEYKNNHGGPEVTDKAIDQEIGRIDKKIENEYTRLRKTKGNLTLISKLEVGAAAAGFLGSGVSFTKFALSLQRGPGGEGGLSAKAIIYLTLGIITACTGFLCSYLAKTGSRKALEAVDFLVVLSQDWPGVTLTLGKGDFFHCKLEVSTTLEPSS